MRSSLAYDFLKGGLKGWPNAILVHYEAALEQLGSQPKKPWPSRTRLSGSKALEAGISVIGLYSNTHKPNELREAGADLIVGDYADVTLYERLDG